MSENDIHGIESGWSVKTADGQGIGSVEETTDRYILVKSGLINASHRYLPAATLAHVRPELKEIGISLTAEAVEQGDWSEPPTEGPRTEGAPLNVDSDAEADAVMGVKTNVDPEKPAEEFSHRV
ncbi:MAG: hypothetical protein H0U86_05670 [Chloroflexi bacterium]|nr:hypothetical protein [Chloroflexota bacterium]